MSENKMVDGRLNYAGRTIREQTVYNKGLIGQKRCQGAGDEGTVQPETSAPAGVRVPRE